ncbi:hypothetical protein A3A48_01240 [Candidatus Curtissbacteria bacterium RIFCSPLOWO2_01_FULL_37_9]|uniref:HTH cro/C1-type domain-containing protein n=1 Tax=Candidatus Curtissbacteria bacterium RIFCSPLOWO2_01_FULL_37_9 TaxID=1797724 RepID=A0A1F5GQL6_9BACT|nr:MAG: hypothetical protein A3A48_01240 [Candidatus Curtissbacteria bacterium RIFCSPLOWO2_01_FULL_37_9]
MAQRGRRTVGDKIKKFREHRSLSQEELSAILNISITHMGYLEQNRRVPSLKLLRKIAKALKVPAKDLI